MNLRIILWSLAGLVVLGLAGFAGWLLTLPPAPANAAAPPVPDAEAAATVAALEPPKRARPVIAVLGINERTEATDYLMPTGILRRADVADVLAVATGEGPVQLYPALAVQPDMTVAAFDARYPDGADYVVVPAMEPNDDPAALAWLRRQAGHGAVVIGVCAGATVVAEAGLLDGRRATTHWYYLKGMLAGHPTVRYVADRRYLADGPVATTTGITASMPMTLTLIEAIAGRQKAEETARGLGLDHWDARHPSAAFRFNRPFAATVLGNVLAFWNREEWGIELTPGIDEVALALVADAWSRTYRSRAVTFAPDGQPVATRSGLRVIPDRATGAWPDALRLKVGAPPVAALEQALGEIAVRYGSATRSVVAMQLEYPEL
jgi:putative intracellular protease/amidase